MAKKSNASSMVALANALAPAAAPAADAAKDVSAEGTTTGTSTETLAPTGDAAAATASAPATATPPAKEDKGPVKITTNQQLCKALWSSRGNVFFDSGLFPIPLAVVKKEMTEYLKTVAGANDPAPFDLVPRADNTGSDLIPRPEYAEWVKSKASAETA